MHTYEKFLEAINSFDLEGLNKAQDEILSKHLFTDSLCPFVGNKFAFNDFLSRNSNQGFHVSVELNNFSEINEKFGNTVSDKVVLDFFKVISKISRSLGGKCFRVGGDSSKLHFDSKDQATSFSNELQKQLKDQSVNGMGISASVGIGYSSEQADACLQNAAQQLSLIDVDPKPTVVYSCLNQAAPASWTKTHHEKKEGETKLKLAHPLK